MRSLLLDIASAFNNVYSGWIWWNLFLAFIPLLLSYGLFRRQAIPRGWWLGACLLLGVVGVVGLWRPRGGRYPAATALAHRRHDPSGGHEYRYFS